MRAASIFLSGESELEGLLVDCVRTGKTAIELASGTTNWIEYYREEPARAAVFNTAMTALSNAHLVIRTGGCERSEAEYRALYKAAGFKLTRAIETSSPTGMTIIEGKPA